jgi:hypothetical protein
MEKYNNLHLKFPGEMKDAQELLNEIEVLDELTLNSIHKVSVKTFYCVKTVNGELEETGEKVYAPSFTTRDGDLMFLEFEKKRTVVFVNKATATLVCQKVRKIIKNRKK